jgi:putative peptidoglycan lipid II flippase
MFLCIGLAGWAAQTVISRGFYALGSTWLPTIVGTIVTAGFIPLYVVLRQYWGAVGLAVASSVSILIYVMLLGWLQRRRFEREAMAKGTTLDRVPGMLDTALRLAAATAVAIAVGLALRPILIQLLPDNHVAAIVIRAAILCVVGLGTYLSLARVLGVRELAEVERMALEITTRSRA